MIPLNKPGYVDSVDSKECSLSRMFPERFCHFTPTAGDGLNFTYQYLYKKYGHLRVAVSPFSCFQAIYPIVLNGHTPVFVDTDVETFNMDVAKLSELKEVDAIEVINLGGNPNDMAAICKWSKGNGTIIIEDCAQAYGSQYDGRALGNFGDFACFSLIKNLHTYIGGLFMSKQNLVVEDVDEVSPFVISYRKAKKYLESHADYHSVNVWNLLYFMLLKMKDKNKRSSGNKVYGLSTDVQNMLIQAISTFEVLNHTRLSNAHYIIGHIDMNKYVVQKEPQNGVTNRNRLLLRLKNNKAEEAITYLRKSGIAANNLTQNYLKGFQPHIKEDELLGEYYTHKLGSYEKLLQSVIAVPCSAFLTVDEMNYIIEKLNKMS